MRPFQSKAVPVASCMSPRAATSAFCDLFRSLIATELHQHPVTVRRRNQSRNEQGVLVRVGLLDTSADMPMCRTDALIEKQKIKQPGSA